MYRLYSKSFFFWLQPVACGILVLQPRMKPVSPALKAWSLKHWTTREILIILIFFFCPC